MQIRFRAIQEAQPAAKWAELFRSMWPAYEAWFLKEGDAARPTYLACKRALRQYMPELLSTWERLIDLAGGGDRVARFLSLYRPTPYLTGCSQAVWTRGRPRLIRNYDYSPRLWEGLLLHTAWHGRRVVAMSDCVWGALDGINDAGLAVSLSFGGRNVVGDGFGIPLVLRYILEFCDTTTQAADVLRRVPLHMAYNVTLLDAAGEYLTVLVSPDRPTAVTRRPVATNHQHKVEWVEYECATGSVDRERLLSKHRHEPGETVDRFIERFLLPPLFAVKHAQGWGTLYTAVYEPRRESACYRWPAHTCEQAVDKFTEMTFDIAF